jgi:hypothetical protein
MIVPSKDLRKFINMFDSQNEFAKEYDIDPATLSRYLNEEISCSSGFIESVKIKSGLDFEKAFEVK